MKQMFGSSLSVRVLLFLSIAVALGGVVLPLVAQYKADTNPYARDEQELRKVEREWAQAMEREDAATVDKIIGPEYTFVDAVGIVANRQQFLQDLQSGNVKFDSFVTQDIKPRIFQGGGVLMGKLTTKGKYKNEDISGEYYFVDIFEFKQGAWKALYTQITQIKPPGSKAPQTKPPAKK